MKKRRRVRQDIHPTKRVAKQAKGWVDLLNWRFADLMIWWYADMLVAYWPKMHHPWQYSEQRKRKITNETRSFVTRSHWFKHLLTRWESILAQQKVAYGPSSSDYHYSKPLPEGLEIFCTWRDGQLRMSIIHHPSSIHHRANHKTHSVVIDMCRILESKKDENWPQDKVPGPWEHDHTYYIHFVECE